MDNQGTRSLLIELRSKGRSRRTDINDRPIKQILEPEWLDRQLFDNAKLVYARHLMAINLAHLLGLILLVRVNSIYVTLNCTGKSSSVARLFRRYVSTVLRVKSWYEGDIFDPNSEANHSLLAVRNMHDAVARRLNRCQKEQSGCPVTSEESYHISEYDIMLTQFAFIGLIVMQTKRMGLMSDFNKRDLESILHFWRVIGHVLGATDEYNLCSRSADQVHELCQEILDVEMKPSLILNPINGAPGVMSINIVRSIDFVPMMSVYGAMRLAYELIGFESENKNQTNDVKELAEYSNYYGRLSYTLMRLVTHKILAIGFMRSFNNGITRLSFWCIKHLIDWNEKRLSHTFGDTLIA